MSDAGKDVDEAAEPFMEQAKTALGDVTADEDADNAGNPAPRLGERGGSHPQTDMRSKADPD
jgi:hypothetical protein